MEQIIFDGRRLTIEDIEGLAKRRYVASLSGDSAFKKRIEAGSAFLEEVLRTHGKIYGVTTGYGDSCGKEVPPSGYGNLSLKLTRFHGCGLGRYFDEETTRAVIAVRLQSLVLGYSGVSFALLEALARLLIHDVLPLIPEEGSVGASGDLTPLSYVAAVIAGEREALYKGERRPAADILKELNAPAVTLGPKEGLAIMNGTAAMTAVACLAYRRAAYLADIACRITAFVSVALRGNAYHFDERLFAVKPHPGQMLAAARLRRDLDIHSKNGLMPERLQDPYSVRCAPHVIGVFYDAAPLFRQVIENELNSANDNPIVDPASRSILHGGHFYGGHIAFIMDSMKNVVANLADLIDRQIALLVDEKYNRGLPPNLTGSSQHAMNHGLKAVQIASSAFTAEALKNTMPASVFSRSTECHNQDKVSMGTIAARDCARVIELTEQVAAAGLLAAGQAVRLRLARKEITPAALTPMQATLDRIDEVSPFLAEDRPLEKDLRALVDLIRRRALDLGYDD